jgi:hypothetical protein
MTYVAFFIVCLSKNPPTLPKCNEEIKQKMIISKKIVSILTT